VTSSKKKRSAAFYFVIDHLQDCRPLVASLWHEGFKIAQREGVSASQAGVAMVNRCDSWANTHH